MTKHYNPEHPEEALTELISCRFTDQTHLTIEELAVQDNCTRAQVIRNAVDYYLGKRAKVRIHPSILALISEENATATLSIARKGMIENA